MWSRLTAARFYRVQLTKETLEGNTRLPSPPAPSNPLQNQASRWGKVNRFVRDSQLNNLLIPPSPLPDPPLKEPPSFKPTSKPFCGLLWRFQLMEKTWKKQAGLCNENKLFIV